MSGKEEWHSWGTPFISMERFWWVPEEERFASLHEVVPAPVPTPEEIYAEKELRKEATQLLSKKLSRPREAAIRCFVAGGSMDEAMEEYRFVHGIEFASTLGMLGRSVITPFQPRV